MTPFNGGEGIWHDGGILYFTTKGDTRVWAYDSRSGMLEILFDRATAMDSSLDAVDNVTVSQAGEIFVCEDGGNMEIGLITPEREVSPFLRFTGDAHPTEGQFKSEVCGVDLRPVRHAPVLHVAAGAPAWPQRTGAGRGVRDQRAVPAAGHARHGHHVRAARGERSSGPLRAAQDEKAPRCAWRCGAGSGGGRSCGVGSWSRFARRRGRRSSCVLDTADLIRSAGPGRHDRAAAHRRARAAALPRPRPGAATAPAAGSGGEAPPEPPPARIRRAPARDGPPGGRPPARCGAAESACWAEPRLARNVQDSGLGSRNLAAGRFRPHVHRGDQWSP